MDFQEFVEMMIKVWKDDGYHNYGHGVIILGEEQLREAVIYVLAEFVR